jgi:hypothetical protein
MADSSIVQGGTFNFFVEARNKFGEVVPVSDANVALDDSALGTVGVNGDGTDGQFSSTDGTGTETLTPSAGGTTGTPYVLDITQDLAVASVAIVAQGQGPVTSVKIVRRGAPLRR